MLTVTSDYAKIVCKLGQGEKACAYLAMDNGVRCAKGTDLELEIRLRLAEGTWPAKGDNCSGVNVTEKKPCAEYCANFGLVCKACEGDADMALCKFDPNLFGEEPCRSRCTNPDGPCAEGKTFYEKIGFKLE